MIVKVRDPRFDDAVDSGRLKHMNLVSTEDDRLPCVCSTLLLTASTLIGQIENTGHHMTGKVGHVLTLKWFSCLYDKPTLVLLCL